MNKEELELEEEFTDGMVERLDYLDNITVDYLSQVCGRKLDKTTDLGVSEIVGEVLELACNMLNLIGFYSCYPFKSEDDNSPIEKLCTHAEECPVLEAGLCEYKK